MGVSVVVPVYNAEKYLSKCLDSICAQDDCVQEIILVNDGSRDTSLEICEQYALKDRRIKIINQENGGTMAAIMSGVGASSSPYIGFVDSDDTIAPEMYRKMLETIEETDADVCICDFFRTYSDGKKEYQEGLAGKRVQKMYERTEEGWEFPLLPTLKQQCCVPPFRWNKLFKKNLLSNNFGFSDYHIRVGEDMALVIPVLFEARKVAYIHEGLYFYEQRAGSLVHSYETSIFFGWKNLVDVLKEAAQKYNYVFPAGYGDVSLAVLLSVCLYKIHISRLSVEEKSREYEVIGEDDSVRQLLSRTRLRTNLKHKLVFLLLKHKKYQLLAKIY